MAAVAVRRRTTTLSSRTTTTTSRRTATTTIPTARSRVGAGRQSLTHSLTPSVCVLRLCCAVLVCLCQCQCLPVCSSVEHERVFECPLLHDGGLASLSLFPLPAFSPSVRWYFSSPPTLSRCTGALPFTVGPFVRSFVVDSAQCARVCPVFSLVSFLLPLRLLLQQLLSVDLRLFSRMLFVFHLSLSLVLLPSWRLAR